MSLFSNDKPKVVGAEVEPEKVEHIKIVMNDNSRYTIVLHQEYDDNPEMWGPFIRLVDENEDDHYFPADQIRTMFTETRAK